MVLNVSFFFLFFYSTRIQQISIANSELTYIHKCNLHAIAAALLALLARVTGVNNIMEYCEKIIESRQEEAAYLLPGLIDADNDSIDSSSLNLPHLMIDKVQYYPYNRNRDVASCLTDKLFIVL